MWILNTYNLSYLGTHCYNSFSLEYEVARLLTNSAIPGYKKWSNWSSSSSSSPPPKVEFKVTSVSHKKIYIYFQITLKQTNSEVQNLDATKLGASWPSQSQVHNAPVSPWNKIFYCVLIDATKLSTFWPLPPPSPISESVWVKTNFPFLRIHINWIKLETFIRSIMKSKICQFISLGMHK